MGKTKIHQAVLSAKRVLEKFEDWGLNAGFVYTTEDGFIHYFGSPAFGDVISENQTDIINHPTFAFRHTRETPDVQDETGQKVCTKLGNSRVYVVSATNNILLGGHMCRGNYQKL